MTHLREALEALRKEDRVSFHMPGHKYGGNGLRDHFNSFWDIDITEIPGADNLHDPEEILLAAKKQAEDAYGSRESFFLVNGSSCGIMAMIMGTVKRGEKIIISRDAHRSIHQAVSLGGLHPIYLMPSIDPATGIVIGMDPAALKLALSQHNDIKAVVCTYPSYSGACVNLPLIRKMTAEMGVQLLVDEAHGAHLWLDENLPVSALAAGADAVVQSLHKTMPAMTQTAILHLGTAQANRDEIARYLTVFQSSSPSYVLLASIDEAIGIGISRGKGLMKSLLAEIELVKAEGRRLGFEFWDGTTLSKDMTWHFDETKLCISGHLIGLDGYELDRVLRLKGIQSEYAVRSHVLLMTSIANVETDFHRLAAALEEISREKEVLNPLSLEILSCQDEFSGLSSELAVLPGEIDQWQVSETPLKDACGKVVCDWIIPYPPGIPMLCPGERVSGDHIRVIEAYMAQGHKILGVKENRIRILTDEKR